MNFRTGTNDMRLRRFLAAASIAALAALSACSDVTGPSDNSETETVVANGPALGGLISNEMTRVMPSVLLSNGSDEITATLDQLASALQAGLGRESRAAITRFTAVVDQYAGSADNPDVAAELAALRHAVDVVREAVEAK